MEDIGNTLLDCFDVEDLILEKLPEWKLEVNSNFSLEGARLYNKLDDTKLKFNNKPSKEILNIKYTDIYKSLTYWT